jgi:hypothetical protein
MKKFIFGLLIGLIFGWVMTTLAAKYESSSFDAQPVMGYGKSENSIYRLKTLSDGTLVIR